ncbi:MAG: DUF2163 domain-containing protein [Alphaproteobacteria bacterium]|nr:DUF2163 domain-containing protein [Alphaproteobacteria bacterium]
MKDVSAALQTHLEGALTTLATLVKITRTDGTALGFTTHDRDIVLDDVTYKACSALTPSSIESRAGLAVDNLEATGILDSDAISDADVKAGRYDFARVDVFVCNWADTSQGAMQLRRGWLGQVTLLNGAYVAELRGLHDLLQQPVGSYYTPECRFDLGDGSCGVDCTALASLGTVTSVTDVAAFADTAQTADDGVYAYGKLTWTSGANAGTSIEVKVWDAATHTFTLWLPMAGAIEVGDAYTVLPGCDKKFSTCRDTFSNGANFGGFPYVPGVGNILKVPT